MNLLPISHVRDLILLVSGDPILPNLGLSACQTTSDY